MKGRQEGTACGAHRDSRFAMIHAIETEMTRDGASPEEVDVVIGAH